jgi:hypothetical protein
VGAVAVAVRMRARWLAVPTRSAKPPTDSATIRDALPHCPAELERADGDLYAAVDPGSALARQRWREMIKDIMHVADRPSWHCRECRTPWPCASVKADLTANMDRIGRIIYLDLHFVDAVGDRLQLSASNLFERFIGWARDS